MANSLLTMNMISREAVAIFRNNNMFLQSIDAQYAEAFAITPAPLLSLPQAVALGAAATLIRNPTVTRRFWSWFKK